MNDPIRPLKTRLAVVSIASVGMCLVALLWGLSPIENSLTRARIPSVSPPEIALTNDVVERRVEASHFARIKFWNPVPPPPPELRVVAKEPPKPIRIQLVGIINEGGSLCAAIYDQEDDRLLIVRSGDQIKNHKIIEVSSKAVELSDGHATLKLQLEIWPS